MNVFMNRQWRFSLYILMNYINFVHIVDIGQTQDVNMTT
jgi:hypothetical protein